MSRELKVVDGAEWRAGWRTLVGSTAAVSTGAALFTYTAGYFVKPMEAALHWTRAEIALGATLAMVCQAIAMPFVGVLTDRYGPRVIGLLGLGLGGLVCLMLAAMPASLPVYYGLLVTLALVFSATTAVVFAPLVVARFQHHRGIALGILMSGTPLLLVVLGPIIISLNTTLSWRAGYVVLAACALLIGLPNVFLAVYKAPVIARKANSDAPGLSYAQAIRTPTYWKIIGGVLAATLPLGGFLNQLTALMSDKGLSIQAVGFLASVFVVMVVVGRAGIGHFLDTLRPPLVGLCVMWATALGVLVLLLSPGASLPLAAVVVALIGCAMGANGDIQAFFAARNFGLYAFSTIFGTSAMCTAVGLGIGALIFGEMHDIFHGYTEALWFAVGAFLLSGLLFGSLPAQPTDPAVLQAARISPKKA